MNPLGKKALKNSSCSKNPLRTTIESPVEEYMVYCTRTVHIHRALGRQSGNERNSVLYTYKRVR